MAGSRDIQCYRDCGRHLCAVATMTEQPGYIKITKNALTGEWRYLVMGDNHEVLSHSEYFTSERAMMDTLDKYYPNWRRGL